MRVLFRSWRGSPGWQAGRRACAPWASDAADADVLEFGVVGQAVLRALAADSRLLHSAEWRDLGRDQPGVDADDAAFERLGHAPRASQVTGVELAFQPDLGVVAQPHHPVLPREPEPRRHRDD